MFYKVVQQHVQGAVGFLVYIYIYIYTCTSVAYITDYCAFKFDQSYIHTCQYMIIRVHMCDLIRDNCRAAENV